MTHTRKPLAQAAVRRTRLVGWILLTMLTACGRGSPLAPDEPVPTFGPCDLQPNYVDEVRLNRWRSFPLAYFFDSASFNEDFVDDYRDAITTGIRRWEDATSNGLGSVVQVTDRNLSQFVITFRDVTPSTTFARTFHATGTPFLAGGEIVFNRTYLTEVEDRVREGELDREVFSRGVAGVAAHEMGHLLGIIGHSSRDDVLMGSSFHDAPTVPDVNTLIYAYCR